MDGTMGIKLTVVTALLGVVLGLVSACSGGVSQADYDAVKQQLTAKEQEAATASQQIVNLRQQLQPAAPREPKRLEAKITLEMGEVEGKEEMFFATADGVKGGPFRLSAGKTVGIHFVNKGEKKHEFLFGRTVQTVEGKLDGYQVNLFEKVAADLFVYASGKMVEIGGAEFEEIEVEPGAEVWIRVNFPTDLKGEWEIGCFVQEPNEKGHYDQGMKGKLIVE